MITLHIREYEIIFIAEENLLKHKQFFIDTADKYSLTIECYRDNVIAVGKTEQLYKLLFELSTKYNLEIL